MKFVLNKFLLGFQKADMVVEVFDRCEDSVKTAERECHSQSTIACNQYQVIGGHPVPHGKGSSMSHPTSNHYITLFVNTCWKHTQPVHSWLLEASSMVR